MPGKRKQIFTAVSEEVREMRTQAARRKVHDTRETTELAVRALTDMKAFAELIVFHGGWSEFGEFHSELVDFICTPQVNKIAQDKFKFLGDETEAHFRRLVLVPRGHLKSTIGTVLYSLWRIYRNPEIRILVACNLQSLAYSFIRELRSHLENPELQQVWNNRPHIPGNLIPELRKKSSARNFNTDTDAEDRKVIWNNVALQVVRAGRFKEPTVFATSVGTTVTGMHFDLVILDDLVDFKNVESEQKKTQVEEWAADVESVLNPPKLVTIGNVHDTLGGEIVINGTRYALDDYYGFLLENAKDIGLQTYIRNVYKNGKDASEGYLWHERYNDRVVQSLQARLSPRRFASQYLNTVYEKDAYLFNTAAIAVIDDDSIFTNSGNLCVTLPGGRVEVLEPIITIDPAFSTSKTGDDCAICVGAKTSQGITIIIDAAVDRMVAADVVASTRRFAEKYQCLRVYSEQNGVGMLLPELFKPESSYVFGRPLVLYSHWELRTKESKIQGVLELPINAGKLMVTQRIRSNEYIWKQLTNYPAVRHDDFLDALVTLHERSMPSRKVFRDYLQNVSFDGVPLRVFSNTQENLGGYLSGYNAARPL